MSSISYADAGVDVEAGNQFVNAMKALVKSTARPGADAEIGGFGAILDLKAAGFEDPLLISTTDGVGTKLKIAIETGQHSTIGIDLVAMCVNDLIVQGGTPLVFLDYYATGKLDKAVGLEIVRGIAAGCVESGCALAGGETAEMPGMYAEGDYDLAGFSVGAVARGHLLPRLNEMAAGDVLLGLPSSGVHSNGYSLVRKLVAYAGLNWHSPAPFAAGKTLADVFLTPTQLYVKPVLAALAAHRASIVGLAHITGGGITENLPRVLPEGLGAVVNTSAWHMPAEFAWMQAVGNTTQAEMLRTFNCGIGFVMVVKPDAAQVVLAHMQLSMPAARIIGQLQLRVGEAVEYSA